MIVGIGSITRYQGKLKRDRNQEDGVILRAEQLAALKMGVRARYHEELRKFFREKFPQLVARFDDATLRAKIAEAEDCADKYGIQSDDGCVAYIGLSLAAGSSFHTDTHVTGYLQSPGKDPDAKIEWLYKRVVEKLEALPLNGGGSQ